MLEWLLEEFPSPQSLQKLRISAVNELSTPHNGRPHHLNATAGSLRLLKQQEQEEESKESTVYHHNNLLWIYTS